MVSICKIVIYFNKVFICVVLWIIIIGIIVRVSYIGCVVIFDYKELLCEMYFIYVRYNIFFVEFRVSNFFYNDR